MIEEINLDSYSLDELNNLIEVARKEIDQREQGRLQNIRIQMEKLANSVGMTPEEIISSEEGSGLNENCTEPRKIKFRNPNNPKQTWSGRGQRPRWLREALDQGASLHDFSIAD